MTSRVGVVIPAHDEQELLPACLAAVRCAAEQAGVPVEVLVVADDCQDATAVIAARWGVTCLTTRARNVGAARRAGCDALLGAGQPAGLWLATTDADSSVPPDWLRRQLGYAAAGADAVVGTVRLAVTSASPAGLLDAFRHGYLPAEGHPHVHGANLGFAAAAYLAAGRMPPLGLAEDVAFIAALEVAGCRIIRAADLPVLTSARRLGRVRGGFADYLSRLPA